METIDYVKAQNLSLEGRYLISITLLKLKEISFSRGFRRIKDRFHVCLRFRDYDKMVSNYNIKIFMKQLENAKICMIIRRDYQYSFYIDIKSYFDNFKNLYRYSYDLIQLKNDKMILEKIESLEKFIAVEENNLIEFVKILELK